MVSLGGAFVLVAGGLFVSLHRERLLAALSRGLSARRVYSQEALWLVVGVLALTWTTPLVLTKAPRQAGSVRVGGSAGEHGFRK